ncbi:quinone-dependent dihydroorotate dehydrogenase [Acidiphilium sp.]|uniref:quinone-dependent dihydroorotate dehydrogenase n=1 Tax=Acidiphilium sp. TaxID=527 RepID=UPI00258373BA|nr:quinone-dependent dihydroorotate dehydrogenase [Acidiphilium sp.]
MPVADLATAALRLLEPETAHNAAIAALRLGLAGRQRVPADPRLAMPAFGRTIALPIGLAAGFDKNAAALAGLSRLGFGFVEAGTVTRRPQPGNPKPRLFRLEDDGALINRMGFNNLGIEGFAARLARTDRALTALGANLGINKEGADPLADYPALVAAVAPHADYVAINVSSPNTPGLRDLQAADRLAAILDAIRAAVPNAPPLFVKLAPDLDEAALPELVDMAIGRAVAGLIVSNTTLARPESLRGAARGEAGGLSGAPLFNRSTRMLARVRLLAGDRLLLIGVGGVATPEQALAKFRAGASLVQVYTAFVYQGPSLLPRLAAGLSALLDQYGAATLAELVGRDADRLAEIAP